MNATIERETSGLAIASLILSIASIIIGPFGFIPGIVCGHLAKKKIRLNKSELKGEGLALSGLIIGYIFLALFTLFILFVVGMALTTVADHSNVLR